MNKTKAFIGLTIMGGLAVMLPVVLLLLIIQWLYGFTSGLLEPITSLLSDKAEINQLLAMLLVTAIFLFLCFLIGLTVRTAIGSWLHDRVDHALVRVAPDYKTIREVVSQLLSGNGDTSPCQNFWSRQSCHSNGYYHQSSHGRWLHSFCTHGTYSNIRCYLSFASRLC